MVAVGLAMIGALGCFLFDSKWIVNVCDFGENRIFKMWGK